MKKLNKNAAKYIFGSLAGLFIIVYFVYQIFQMNSSPYKTEVAFERNLKNSIEATAFVVRDEAYITAENTSGTVVSVAEDGKRVASGDSVAVVFPNENSASVYVRINEIEKEIVFYNRLKNRVGVGTNAPSSYNDAIDRACLDYISASRAEIGGGFDESLNALRDTVTAKQLAVGQKLAVEEKISELQTELNSLRSQSVGYTSVLSPNPGYYIGSVDGLEDAIGYKDVLNVNAEKISSLTALTDKEVPPNIMGKLVDSFNWYMLCNIPYNASGEITEGKTVSVNLPDTSVGTIQCTVAFKGNNEDGLVPVVLRCNSMNRGVANLRIEKIEIITDEYKGIRINNSAIREKDGEKGVFVLRGNIVQFKKINILFSDKDYSIIEKSEDTAFVRQYDTIINEGVDLYDGKVIS